MTRATSLFKAAKSCYSSSPKGSESFMDIITQRDASLERGGIFPNNNPECYEIEREIGFGKYSRVFKSYDKDDHPVVLKVLKPTPIKRVIREISILNTLSNGPNIVKFIEVITDPMSETITLAFEYVKNEVNKTLYQKLTSNDVRYYMFQILRALEYSMSKNIMHRDVKPSNIMIDHSRRQLRLVDWGLAEYYFPETPYSVRVSSLNFKGPELLLGYTLYDYSLDMWCLGCVFAEMLFCKHPFFYGSDPISQIKEIVSVLGTDDIIEYIEKYKIDLENIDQSLASVISGYAIFRSHFSHISNLRQRHHPRSWEEFKSKSNSHKCSADALDLLSKLLVYDHSERLTPTDAMEHPYFDGIRESLD